MSVENAAQGDEGLSPEEIKPIEDDALSEVAAVAEDNVVGEEKSVVVAAENSVTETEDLAIDDKENAASVEPPNEETPEKPNEEDTELAKASKEQVESVEHSDQPSETSEEQPESELPPEAEAVQDEEESVEPLFEDEEPEFKLFADKEQVEEEEWESHPLDELTDQQVVDIVQEMETENRHLALENILFESFLKENDPSLLDGFEEIMDFLLGRDLPVTSSKDTIDRPSASLDKNKFKLDSYTSITSIAEGKGPKINISQKTDMVMRAMEDSQGKLEAFLKKCHIIKRNLKSELQEFSIREAEIKEATDIFEYSVVTQGVDKLTQRIPAEKFIRYMEEWLKSAQLQIEKLRLRIATLKVQYKKVSQQLIQRQELGENVHAVDFDQLEIENKHFIEKIEQKNVHLIELKKMNGGANLVLSTHKKFLQKQQEDCNRLKAEIEAKNKQIEATERECQEADDELRAEIEKYENCKKLKSEYVVPDVMEYVRLKGKLHDIRKNIKIWVRRRKIQDIALNTCLREMKNLTGRTDIDPSWFEDIQSISDDTSSEELL